MLGIEKDTYFNSTYATSAEREVVLRTFSEDGMPLTPEYTVKIPGRSARTLDAIEILGGHADPLEPVVGSVELVADGPGLFGDLFFGHALTANFAAALPLQEEAFTEAVFPHVATVQELFTGLAFFNPAPETCQIEIGVFRFDGQIVGATTLTLPSFGRLSRLVTELIPESEGQAGGFIHIHASHPVIAQQLFGNADLEYLAAVTPVILRQNQE